MSKHTYQSGPPPHVGWWVTKVDLAKGSENNWRWWNGEYWSWHTCASDPIWVAGGRAITKSVFGNKEIQWSHYYPENARVPRVDPRGSSDLLQKERASRE